MDKISVAHFTLTIVSFESVRGLDCSEMNGGIELFHRYVVSYLAVFFFWTNSMKVPNFPKRELAIANVGEGGAANKSCRLKIRKN